MSKLKVNELDTRSGTTITVAAGKTLAGTDIIGSTQIAANAVTLAEMAGLVRGKIIVGDASGDPSALTVGTADQVLQSDGTDAAWADLSTGTAWQAVVTAATLNAVAGNGYPINTTSNACTVTLPAAASVGDTIEFMDYARNWATNALTINPNSLNYQGYTTPQPNYNTNGESLRIVYVDATQGWIPVFDGAVAHETSQAYSISSLVIAGGGGGGGSIGGYTCGGGGGAGGYRNSYASEASGGGASTEATFVAGTAVVYTVTIGAGGVGGNQGSVAAGIGVDSSVAGSGLTTITSAGGGGGGSANAGPALNATAGGSGGGGQYYNSDSGKAGTANQGYDGGDAAGGSGNLSGSGGGGGAAQAGQDSAPTLAGVGGIGLNNTITGSSVGRGGGGGGGQYNLAAPGDPTNPATTATHGGGPGGGGAEDGDAGTVNTGGGGGGGSIRGGTAQSGGAGGSGVVILRMPSSGYTGTISGSPTVSTDGSDTVLIFTGSGSYTG